MRFRKAMTAFILCFAIVFMFFDNAFIKENSDSMAPTLYPGDHFLYFRYASPTRFGIFVVDDPSSDAKLIKRIVGLPKERIAVLANLVMIEGKILNEPYIQKSRMGILFLNPYYFSIPQDHYFVLGDNRDHSRDSRSFGPVHNSFIHERAVLVYWPPSHARWVW